MILTGKAKLDFETWLNKEMYYLGRHNFEDRNNNIEDLSDNFQNALIIEWFDSIGIYVNSSGLTLSKTFISDVSVDNNCEYNYDGFRTRQEALTEAIKKANDIYNSK